MSFRLTWAIGLIVAGAAARAAAADATLKLVLPDQPAHRGEVLLVTIEVSNFTQCGEPALPPIPGCVVGELSSASESSYTSIVNSRVARRVTRTWRFELTPAADGELTIPPISVAVDGKELRTAPRTIRVLESDAEKLLAAELNCNLQRVYVGQRISVTLTIRVMPAGVGNVTLEPEEMFRLIDGRGLGPFDSGFRVASRGDLEDERYAFACDTYVTPRKPGPLEIDDLVVSFSYPTKFSRDIFGRIGPAEARQLRVVPRPLIDVLPLPAAGRPANFSGAVGRYKISVSAKSTRLRVGDPVELSIEITGEGAIDTLGAPPLDLDPRLSDGFTVSGDVLAGEVRGITKRFVEVIRPKRTGLTEIPPLEYAYFDPFAGRYDVVRSQAIPIRVAPAEVLNPSDLAGIAVPDPAAGDGRAESLDGLRGVETDESLLLASQPPVRAWELAAAVFAPPVVFMMVWAPVTYARTRRGDAAGRRRGAALSVARRRIGAARSLPPAQAAREIRAAMSSYLADRLGQPPGRFDGQSSTQWLEQAGVDEELHGQWRRMIDDCETASFGGGAGVDVGDLARRGDVCVLSAARERLQ